ncbi:L,D-transpeptidase family protein [Alteriqipengyuania flavescens]|uniref:L,D-transpeptidase family protein n=1 Tax=Alteriqipengyuania flavescens TaxID=3053610 RepID=UPI0025B3FE52|nr:L,D-transpeptidase family protein [Alteriqipengyuania flavescens]WJY17572.1 L,D-transpeptidase family protein [Alteriqipengyuania flavescens]WJY23515.1 L,D-transpeptidase family protein [Alteriqipengyuania flavescens]
MNGTVKWIGGATLLVLALLVTAGVSSRLFMGSAAEASTQDAAIQAEAVLEQGEETKPQAKEEKLDSPFVIKRILPIDGPIRYGEWHWDDEGVPDGPLVITVDLEARVISVFRDGYEIGAAAVLLGTDNHPTPLGVFPILEKNKDNISSIYNVPMPYTLRLTWDGISIHSSEVENGFASHGCIGTPDAFAAKLFAIAKLGDRVIITRGEKAGIGTSLAS